MVVGFIYGFVCLAGTFAVFFPGLCTRFLGARRPGERHPRGIDTRATRIFGVLLSHGHHPLGSEESASHELRLGGKSFCASCFGLLTGAIASSITLTVFLFSDWMDGFPPHLLYFLALGGIALGFVPSLLGTGARTRFALGAVFVTGTCLTLLATDVATANLTSDLFVVLLSLFWLICRISLSNRK